MVVAGTRPRRVSQAGLAEHRVALRLSVSVAVRAHWDRADSRTMKGTQESSAIGHPVF
jgi:hypothetical protein